MLLSTTRQRIQRSKFFFETLEGFPYQFRYKGIRTILLWLIPKGCKKALAKARAYSVIYLDSKRFETSSQFITFQNAEI